MEAQTALSIQINEAPERTRAAQSLRDAVLHEALSGLHKPAGEQKTLSPWLFYDERGSELFEQITGLPEYYPTRTEREIFQKHGPELPMHLVTPVTVVELGAGTAGKTGVLLREFVPYQGDILYQPIDISPSALDHAVRDLPRQIPGVRVAPQVANYITEPYTITRPEHHMVLALYIGSSIGNFSPAEATAILRNLRVHLEPGDALLLGVDLAPAEPATMSRLFGKKTVAELISAYDDAQGVTAAFNKNILVRLNRELNADFNLDCFAHRARWNARESRMEMPLESLAPQLVHIEGRPIHFVQGETIHTENSYKFTEASLTTLLESAGFDIKGRPLMPGLLLRDDQDRFLVAQAFAN